MTTGIKLPSGCRASWNKPTDAFEEGTAGMRWVTGAWRQRYDGAGGAAGSTPAVDVTTPSPRRRLPSRADIKVEDPEQSAAAGSGASSAAPTSTAAFLAIARGCHGPVATPAPTCWAWAVGADAMPQILIHADGSRRWRRGVPARWSHSASLELASAVAAIGGGQRARPDDQTSIGRVWLGAYRSCQRGELRSLGAGDIATKDIAGPVGAAERRNPAISTSPRSPRRLQRADRGSGHVRAAGAATPA